MGGWAVGSVDARCEGRQGGQGGQDKGRRSVLLNNRVRFTVERLSSKSSRIMHGRCLLAAPPDAPSSVEEPPKSASTAACNAAWWRRCRVPICWRPRSNCAKSCGRESYTRLRVRATWYRQLANQYWPGSRFVTGLSPGHYGTAPSTAACAALISGWHYSCHCEHVSDPCAAASGASFWPSFHRH
ncbi:hypothetical protein P154DRAFT_252558 [Amniculicola lignicola CBS 123094]|uniref:Uncharacterized protein n=1 Tax=Amniculicola lignicola CBS 123094 TaxID=1392246 RepID=A0A6A5WBD8_9PLEO|nr:hypothetical protein P154DRAFT_252558 [Amniculicola lignicola CBS 123094]